MDWGINFETRVPSFKRSPKLHSGCHRTEHHVPSVECNSSYNLLTYRRGDDVRGPRWVVISMKGESDSLALGSETATRGTREGPIRGVLVDDVMTLILSSEYPCSCHTANAHPLQQTKDMVCWVPRQPQGFFLVVWACRYKNPEVG